MQIAQALLSLLPLSLLFCSAEEAAAPRPAEAAGIHQLRADALAPPHATAAAATMSRMVDPPAGAHLTVPPRFSISTWAAGWFDEPRNMLVAPGGEVLVADGEGGEVIGVSDRDHNGIADAHHVIVAGLRQPFGLAFWNGWLYVGATNAILRYRWKSGVELNGGEKIATLPEGGHWTRNLAFSPDGSKLYVSIGSSSNDSVGEPRQRAAVLEMNPDGSGQRVFASGLRNPVGLAFQPGTRTLYTVVNERDGLGDNLPPDYFTSIKEGGFYGWPYAYLGAHPDPENGSKAPKGLIAATLVPDVLFQAHSAPLCFTFYNGAMFPQAYHGSAFVALHGSWNRAQLTGFKVVRVPFAGGKPVGNYEDFVSGWVLDAGRGQVWGRPVGLAVLPDGSLLISDDGAKKIWRLSWK